MFARWIKNFCAAIALGVAVAACGGGGGGDDGTSSGESASASIGAAGGTAAMASGAQVVVPAGALATTTTIGVAKSGAGAPALPAGVTVFGPIFAFTPHGTTFAGPATITVPFDPSLVPPGATPVLYKTNPANTGWMEVTGATLNGTLISGDVTGSSSALAGSKPTPPLEKGTPMRQWATIDFFGSDGHLTNVFERVPEDPTRPDDPPKVGEIGGLLERTYDFGFAQMLFPGSPLPSHPPNEVHASGRLFASPGGGIYGASTEAPVASVPFDPSGSQIWFLQRQSYLKRAVNAKLQVHVKQARIELFDAGPSDPAPCTQPECRLGQSGHLQFFVTAYNKKRGTFYNGETTVSLDGWRGHWNESVTKLNRKALLMWGEESMPVDKDVGLNGMRHARISLSPDPKLFVPIDISMLDKDEEFTLQVELNIDADDHRLWNGDAPSYAGVFFRDPTRIDGDPEILIEGLEPTDRPEEPPPPDDPSLSPECRAKPSAGTLSIVSPAYLVPEAVGATGVNLVVTRSQGTSGEVSATLTTSDGTATAPGDYQSVRTTVTFKNGDVASQRVSVPLVYDPAAEGDKTFTVTLSEPTGCATLGQATSLVTIVDGTKPLPAPPAQKFSLGGTVIGLAGSGLVLRTNAFDEARPTADGTFSFPQRVANGSGYTVSVATPPANPLQICTITNGSGTIAGADVSNIRVDCVTPAANSALDLSFGSQGKLFGSGGNTALALQADGKLLAVGGMTLTRFNADGSVDAGFGSGGAVNIVAKGGPLDAMRALALQRDGKIVVAGFTSLPTSGLDDDFVVFRFNADGSLDSGFGSGGKVITDFNGLTDRAQAVMVQPDGKIVAAGNAVLGTVASADQDFAVVRYLPDGTLDPAFGTGGKATLNITGITDIANAAALQPDGKIVVVGRTFHDRFGRSEGNPDIGVGRFRNDGSVDTGFGTQGVVRIDSSIAGGVVTVPDFDGADWDDADDVAVHADGRIVIGGYTITAGVRRTTIALLTSGGQLEGLVASNLVDEAKGIALQADGKFVVAGNNNGDFALVRFLGSGALDTSFASGGQLRVDFFGGFDSANDVLVQPDGKIVAVGSASNGASRGTGLVRVLP